jgi:hypothetical protein
MHRKRGAAADAPNAKLVFTSKSQRAGSGLMVAAAV